jgi:anti-sigma B factor antagonist
MFYWIKVDCYWQGAANLCDHVAGIAPAVVEMPAEIDVTNSEQVTGALNAALASGVTVVIADMTSTVFCDSSGVRTLLHAHLEAQAHNARFRLAMPPDSPVRRVLQLTGTLQVIPIYPAVPEAVRGDGD